MKKNLVILCCLALVAMAGCSRAYIATMDRVDIEVAGNQGVIYGPTPAPHRVENSTREVYSVDIELPTVSGERNTASSAGTTSSSQPSANVAPKKAEKIK